MATYTRNIAGERYVTHSRFGPVGRDTGRRTVLVNLDARRRAPVGEHRAGDQWAPARVPGALKRSIHSDVVQRGPGPYIGEITADARGPGRTTSYAESVHEGSEGHPILPRRKRYLRWPGADGTDVFRLAVYHPGNRRGNPFLREALEAARG